MATIKDFEYRPGDEECEKASNSYVMSLIAVMAGLPIPILNLVATFIFFMANRNATPFVRWHCTQALTSQVTLLFINGIAFQWTIRIIFYDLTFSDNYFAYLIAALSFNLYEFIITIYAAGKVRKGKHVEWFFFGPLTNLLVSKQKTNEGKLFFQFTLLFIPFILAAYILSFVDFKNKMEFEKFSAENERQLGKLMHELFIEPEKEIKGEEINKIVNELKIKLCDVNGMNPDEIEVYILRNSMVNAFALPDKQLVLYSELIEFCDTPEELASVMAHEIGHMYHKHVMKKLVKEIGLSMLFAVISGDAGGKIMKDIAKKISSTSFDREYEEEADSFAVETMQKAGLDPIHFANFLYNIANKFQGMPESLEFISTHPDSKKRAAEVIQSRDTTQFSVIDLGIEDWDTVKIVSEN